MKAYPFFRRIYNIRLSWCYVNLDPSKNMDLPPLRKGVLFTWKLKLWALKFKFAVSSYFVGKHGTQNS